MREENQLITKYVPKLLFDKNEPFLPKAIFYNIYHKGTDIKSKTSKYEFKFGKDSNIVIEYAIYYTYDIQHLYDLEHVFVYLNENENVEKVVSSFHGKFYKSTILEINNFYSENRILLYVQPGKHALMPNFKLFQLFDSFYEACNIESGNSGFLINA